MVPITEAPPLHSVVLAPDVILEQHSIPNPAEYLNRQAATHLLFLSHGDPVRVECRFEGRWQNECLFPGNLWIIPHQTQYSCSFHGAHGGVLLSIGPMEMERRGLPIARSHDALRFAFNLDDPQLRHCLLALHALAREHAHADSLMADSLVQAICLRLLTRHAASRITRFPLHGGLPAASLKRVLEYIDANLQKNIRLATLAGIANISLYHFAKLFRRTMGVSPHQYVLEQRIHRAKQMLREKRASVLDISLSLGFEHPNNFARAFRRLTGGSPSQFRRSA